MKWSRYWRVTTAAYISLWEAVESLCLWVARYAKHSMRHRFVVWFSCLQEEAAKLRTGAPCKSYCNNRHYQQRTQRYNIQNRAMYLYLNTIPVIGSREWKWRPGATWQWQPISSWDRVGQTLLKNRKLRLRFLHLFFQFTTIFVVYVHLYVLYFVLDFLFVFCFTKLCAFIILFPYYSSIQRLSCKSVFIKLLCIFTGAVSSFYPLGVMHAVQCVPVCLSVCPSVTLYRNGLICRRKFFVTWCRSSVL